MLTRILAAAAGVAALTTAAPAAAAQQYQYPYAANPGYQGPYNYRPGAFENYPNAQQPNIAYPYRGHPYTSGNFRPGAFDYSLTPQLAGQMCGTAVQARLSERRDLPRAIATAVGADGGRVIYVTQAVPKTGYVQVRGLASTDVDFGPYAIGAYGALAYTYANAADLTFRCTVTAREGVTNVDISRIPAND